MDQPILSIIIVSWNVSELLTKNLLALEKSSHELSFETWVIDNASSDGTAERIRRDFTWVHLIANPDNRGFAKANNQALRKVRTPYILILNPDTEVRPGALRVMVDLLETHPDIGIVCPRIENPDGTLQPSLRRFPNPWTLSLVLLKLTNLAPWLPGFSRYLGRDIDYAVSQDAEQCMGAAFMVRKEALDAVGLFDEDYWIWMEEVDLMKRMHDAGKRIVYTPNARVLHHLGKSFSQVKLLTNAKRMTRSTRHYARKHFSFFGYLMIVKSSWIHIALTFFWSKVKRV